MIRSSVIIFNDEFFFEKLMSLLPFSVDGWLGEACWLLGKERNVLKIGMSSTFADRKFPVLLDSQMSP